MEWIALVFWSCICFVLGAIYELTKRTAENESMLKELHKFIKEDDCGKKEKTEKEYRTTQICEENSFEKADRKQRQRAHGRAW